MQYTKEIISKPFKIVLIGDAGSGKTNFVNRIAKGTFENKYISTFGFNCSLKALDTTKGNITLDIWDTAGQDKSSTQRESYYVGADAAIIFFDLTSTSSFKNVDFWKKTLGRVVPNIPIILCGNKHDLGYFKVKPNQIRDYLNVNLDINYFEASAKNNYNLDEMLLSVARNLTNSDLKYSNSDYLEDCSEDCTTDEDCETLEEIEEDICHHEKLQFFIKDFVKNNIPPAAIKAGGFRDCFQGNNEEENFVDDLIELLDDFKFGEVNTNTLNPFSFGK